ncbi:MAG: hypothetical protein U0L05_06195 [Schaedlerella sp.]|nr:hypothetical protein [Schaedlerella sp.]
MILLGTLSTFFSVENYILTFSTPEKAFNYINSEEVKLVVEGQESTLVIAEEAKQDYVHLVIPKCSNGWKLGRGIDTNLKKQMMDKGIVLNLYQYRESGEYYITILDMSGEKFEIIDNCNSAFVTFDDIESNQGFKFYFAYIPLYDDNYWIKVNNHKYSFDSLGNEELIYNANSFQFFHILIIFLGVLVFVSIVLIVIIKEFKKLQRKV